METTHKNCRESRKKILVITYYWPPSGGPGVLRWLHFCNALAKDNDVVVLTTKDGDYPTIDKSLSTEIDPRIKVFRTKSISLLSLAKQVLTKKETIPYGSLQPEKNDSIIKRILLKTRVNLVLPDARVTWNFSALKKATQIIKEFGVHYIITTGPPNSTHLIGLAIKKKIKKISWIVDFRDPWTDAFWIQSVKRWKISKKIDMFLEKKVLSYADKIFTVSPSIKLLFQKKDFRFEKKTHLFLNGFSQLKKAELAKEKKIVFFGNLTPFQNPKSLFEAVRKGNDPDIVLEFIGRKSSIFEALKVEYSDLNIVSIPYLPYKELMNYVQDAMAFFLPYVVTGNYTDGIIGTKFFDYIQLHKPIIALGKKHSYAEEIIIKNKLGYFFEYDDVNGISNCLNSLILNFENKVKWEYGSSINEYKTVTIAEKISTLIK